jgi:hypothetical protein
MGIREGDFGVSDAWAEYFAGPVPPAEGGVNWEAYSHDELYQMLWQDADVADVSTVATEWARHRTALTTHAEVLREQCAALRDSWQGPGADEAVNRLEALAARVEKISELAHVGGQAAQEAADALAMARAMMPPPPGNPTAPITNAMAGVPGAQAPMTGLPGAMAAPASLTSVTGGLAAPASLTGMSGGLAAPASLTGMSGGLAAPASLTGAMAGVPGAPASLAGMPGGMAAPPPMTGVPGLSVVPNAALPFGPATPATAPTLSTVPDVPVPVVPAAPASSSTASLESYMASMQDYLSSMQESFSSSLTSSQSAFAPATTTSSAAPADMGTAFGAVGGGGSSFYFGSVGQDQQKAQAVRAMQTYESNLTSSSQMLGDARGAVPPADPLTTAASATSPAQGSAGVPWQRLVGSAPVGGLRAGSSSTGAIGGGAGSAARGAASLGPGARFGALPGSAGGSGMQAAQLAETAAARAAGQGGMVPPVGHRGASADDEQHENQLPTLDHGLFDVEVPTVAPVIGGHA